MCGFVGFCNLTEDISSKDNIYKMNETLIKRGPDNDGYYLEKNICLGHKRLIVIDPKGGKQPMTFIHNNTTYTIVFNGQIYNFKDLKNELFQHGFSFDTNSDTEVLLKAFICWNYEVIHKINGIFSFAIWNSTNKELFLARDHFGVKPLFYTISNNTLIFASEIKALLQYPNIMPIIDNQSINELFGIGPARTAGLTPFKDIFELKPASYALFNESGFHTYKYWSFVSKTHTDSLNVTCEKIKSLLEDTISKQMISDVPICTFLSGGLDSSIITLYASKHFQKRHLGHLNTFSVDYLDNDKNFQKSDFQPNSDGYYIDIMKKYILTNHQTITLDTPELFDSLEDAMIARDLPGMADVDSSLLLFCKKVKPFATVALTGECADEIFGGYPWFYRQDALNSNTFPWSIAINERQQLLNPNISRKINLKDYIDFRYFESLKDVMILDEDSMDTAEKRKISFLTQNWFMQTLLDRSDRMSMYCGLELRVPFCDYRLAEYLWNIPWEMKSYNNREKGLLRYIMKDELPQEIIQRKKSPYPKTWNPSYLKRAKTELDKIVKNPNAPIHRILNTNYIVEILNTDGNAFTRPWFGQLMTGPQLMAYLYQVNLWLETYKPIIDIK